MRHFRLLVPLACVLPGVASCHGDPGGEVAPLEPVSTNLGIAVDGLTGAGDLWLAIVPETGNGGRDLNGDGDALDRVAHVLDLSTGELTNTSMAVPPANLEPLGPVGGGKVAILVSEAAQGATDLNGDGDTDDNVMHIHDARAHTTQSLGIAGRFLPPFVGEPMLQLEGVLGFLVNEEEERRDLDGDGLVEPFASTLHLHDSAHGLVNVGVASTIQPVFHAGFLGLTVAESTVDLDGDGDTGDFRVLHFFELSSRRLISAGVDLGTDDLVAGGSAFVAAVSERTSGFQDLNFDGDRDDAVFRAIDPATGAHTELGFSAPFNALFPAVVTSSGRIALAAGEEDGIDRNGDGDLQDILPVVFDPATGRVFEPGLEVHYTGRLVAAGDAIAMTVDEPGTEEDLNGDGDTLDAVLHVVDPARGSVRNLGIAVAGGMLATPRYLVASVLEDAQGADLDGDGGLGEAVPFLWEPRTGALTNTGLSTTGASFVGGGRGILFLGHEELGSSFRFEFMLYDVRTGQNSPLGLESDFQYFAGMGLEDRAAVAASEARAGGDLNGDGDLDDDVLFLVE